MKRPRVALLRGPYLGAFEAQNYVPLLAEFDVRAYILPQNRFDLAGCGLPVTICRYRDSRLLGGRSLMNAWRTRIQRQRYPMPGIHSIVNEADVVHTFEGWYTYTQQAARVCRRRGVPLVITHWDTIPYKNKLPRPGRAQIDEAYAVASRVLAPTRAAREALRSNGVPEAKIVDQGMGVDASRFSPGVRDSRLAARLGIHENDFVFLFIGRLAEDKGMKVLLPAFLRLRQNPNVRRVRMLLVGAGPDEDWIRAAAQSGGLREELIVAPPVPYGEIHQWHRLGDVYVSPSVPSPGIEEQFGYALVEAMSTGRAVITTRAGGVPDVVGDAARVVAPADVDGLAEAMGLLYSDTEERRRLGEMARQRVEQHYSATAVAGKLREIYRGLIGS